MPVILTPDQRLRVFVSSTLAELADERRAVRRAITDLGLTPVLFEMGARPHPPRDLYRAYLAQSDVFVGIYWERYGWVAPGETVSGLEDEYLLSGDRPKLMYLKAPAADREPRLAELLDRVGRDPHARCREFGSPEVLAERVADDLMRLLTERFQAADLPSGAGAREREPVPYVDASLPAAPTPLVGRRAEIAEVGALLCRDEIRLVTLTGPGGIGKTRLAMAVAEQLLPEFADGVLFVSLAEVTDPERVPAALAAAIGVAEAPGDPLDAVAHHLGRRQTLLVVDNLEQVLDAAPGLARLLVECPRLTVLATSRARLQLSAEHDIPVRPLAVPPRSLRDGADVASYDAVQLFVDRARAADADVDLARDAGAIAEIVRRVDGLPLAVELAAARARLLSPDALLSRLDARLRLLTSGARDLPERQRTLRATIDWSYGLLPEPDQRLLARLAVFRGGRSFEAVDVVCNEAADVDVLSGLGALIDSSLVTQQPGVGGEPRFLMLETIHEYARERLEGSGELASLRASHARYFADLVARATPELRGPGQVTWLTRLAEEHANLQAAMAYAVEADDPQLGLSIAAVSLYWAVRGSPQEGLQWLRRFLDADGGRVAPALRARGVTAAGLLAVDIGDLPAAETHFADAAEMYRALGDDDGLAKALNGLAIIASNRQEFERAASLYEQSGSLRVKRGDTAAVAQTHNNIGFVWLCRGDLDAAGDHLTQALDMARAAGNTQLESIVVGNLAMLALHRGDAGCAAKCIRETMQLAEDLGDPAGVATALETAAALAGVRGRPADAPRLWAAATAIRDEAGVPREHADVMLLAPFLDATAKALGADDFASPVAAAAGLGSDDAVALAREVATY